MPETIPVLLTVFILILGAEFVNGWHDAPNAIATVVSTRVLSPWQAVLMAAVLNVAGALSGTAVATTIGKGIIAPEAIDLGTVAAAMVGIILWNTLTWYLSIPTSTSHSLVAGLAGAGLATSGPGVLVAEGWEKVMVGLVFSTILGFAGALGVITLLLRLLVDSTPGFVRRFFGRAQIFSAAFMAFSHGSNDAQKFMGAATLSLVLAGVLSDFSVPVWVILLNASVMGMGTAVGGWRILRTMGYRLTKLEPIHGFAAETAAATIIEVASRLGIPLSTTHTISTAIMGVGAARRLSAVRWGIARNIATAWIVTFPVCGALAFVTALVLRLFR